MLQKSLLIIVLSLAAIPVHGADLIEVWDQSIRTNPQLASVAANLQAVREQRPQALAELLPSLTASGTVDRTRFKTLNRSQPSIKSTDKVASLDVIQPLFRYDRWIELKKSDTEIAAAEAEYAAALQDLMVVVAERYFQVLDAQDNLEFARAEKNSIGRQLEQAT